MEKMRLLRSQTIRQLSSAVPDNLGSYRSGDFDFLTSDPANYIEIDQQYDELTLSLVDCDTDDHKEVESCIHIHKALGQMPAYLARDSRLWVYLTHSSLLQYTRKRWPIPENDDKAIAHIRKHFFAIGSRGIERDNAASRLWWMAELCSRVNGLSLSEALTSFLHQYDVRANIIERPTTSQSVPILSVILKKLHDSYEGDRALFEREKFRAVMKKLNLQGGVRLLEALEEHEIEGVVEECLK